MRWLKGAMESTWLESVKTFTRISLKSGASRSGANMAPLSHMAAAVLGMGAPVAVGVFTNRMGAGMLAAMGGLALSGAGNGLTRREQMAGLLYTLLSGSAAMLAGASLSHLGNWAAVVFPLVAGIATLVGGISRPMARAMPQFVLYAILAMHYDIQGLSPAGLMVLFMAGAGWYLLITMVFNIQWAGFRRQLQACQNPRPAYTTVQLLRRWIRTLRYLQGWRYALCMTISLAVAELFEWLWPHHHGYWVLITVVIVLQRDVRAMPARMLQRSVGTLIGVLVASVLLIEALPTYAMVALICLLAAARVALREVNYAAYAAVMTVLVIALIDSGSAPSGMPGADRLIATLSGCAIATLVVGGQFSQPRQET